MRDLLKEIMEDKKANLGNPKSTLVMGAFRAANRFARRPERDLVWWMGLPVQVGYRVVVEWILGIEIPAKTQIGRSFRLAHGQGLVIHKDTVIGDHVLIHQNTTIGKRGGLHDTPIIGDHVEIGANAVVLGHIHVGDGARVGAGAVVLQDVPPGALAVGNPARIIERGSGQR